MAIQEFGCFCSLETNLDFHLCLRLVLDCVCLLFVDLGEKGEEN